MVSIITELKNPKAEEIINTILKISKTDPNLSPRTRSELVNTYKKRRLLIAMDSSTPIGWILRVPYSNNAQELAAAYVVEPDRSKGIFTKLLREAVKSAKISILVTFNKQLASYLINKLGFQESSFWEVIKISKGKFLIDRLNAERLIAIVKHFTKNSPTYLIFNRNG